MDSEYDGTICGWGTPICGKGPVYHRFYEPAMIDYYFCEHHAAEYDSVMVAEGRDENGRLNG